MKKTSLLVAVFVVTCAGTFAQQEKVETLNNDSITSSNDLQPITVNQHFKTLPKHDSSEGLTFVDSNELSADRVHGSGQLQSENAGKYRVIDVNGPKAPVVYTKQIIKRGPVNARRGTIRIVEFWATWCGPCKHTIPTLTSIQQKFAGKNVQVIGISDESELEPVETYVKAQGTNMNYTVGFDPDRRTTGAFNGKFKVNTIPHAYLVSHDDRILWHGHPGNRPVLEAAIQEAIEYRDAA